MNNFRKNLLFLSLEKSPTLAKRAKRKKHKTVAKNKDSINHKGLPLVQMPDLILAKTQAVIGEPCGVPKLFLTTMDTKDYTFDMVGSEKFFDTTEYEPIQFNDDDMYDLAKDQYYVELPVSFRKEIQPIRQQLDGYVITNNPLGENDNNDVNDDDYASVL